MLYMFLSILVQSWIIGSITLLVVKIDEKTSTYRDTIKKLHTYSEMHAFDRPFKKQLTTQLKLDFNHREFSDELVLQHFPAALRRKVLRKLYLPALMQTALMQGIRQQFVDAFLTTCSVEIFSPGEEILQRGSISSDLYLLVDGVVEIPSQDDIDRSTTSVRSYNDVARGYGSVDKRDAFWSKSSGPSGAGYASPPKKLDAGQFINEIGFFTESPQIDTVRTVTVCKTLTMGRTAYKMIAEDHPGSVGKILQNLLGKVEAIAAKAGTAPLVSLPKSLEVHRAGSIFDMEDAAAFAAKKASSAVKYEAADAAQTQVAELVKCHIDKQKDDHTTRFLFAASRGDVRTITLMCDQGFDANSADYDQRTALMVAAMKGNTEAVRKILEYNADIDLVDVHGSSALYEAVRNGHEPTIDALLAHGASLCMPDALAASTLCQAVFDGDIVTLRRLLRARIQVDACDYDRRTAAHIAAAEGNVVALRVLVEFGADLAVKDRWNNSLEDEARRAGAGKLLELLNEIKAGRRAGAS
mmetsp:Transcript_12819/g.32472  ORF Transcript_12819/g.32472 Transcript_12819/m.32472 type:complete len:526 (+) Transcript_12819:303-1880(+)